ncbi:MAG: DUF3152 domain-containing protein [bacterium]|nr:DUF3152 domain-containing protein [bacterium]
MSAQVRPHRRHQAIDPDNASPRPRPTSGRVVWRTAFFSAAVVFVISSTSAIAGFEEPIGPPESQPIATTTTTTTTAPTAQPIRIELPPTAAECDPSGPVSCDTDLPPSPAIDSDTLTACSLGTQHQPTGELIIATAAEGAPAGAIRFRVEIEAGLAIDHDCFAETALSILTDDRGWTSSADVDFARVDDDTYDFRLLLASPATTDTLCYPARTAGRYSCRNGEKVIINLMRWTSGTDDYNDNLTTYRQYLLNHEVGHFLGKAHLQCSAPGELAPVMMQQTKGLGECLPNGWPTEVEE